MNLERLRWGDWIAAIAGLDLILVTFRGWYKVTGTSHYVTAWDALDNGRYLLIATGIVGLLLLLYKAAESELPFPPGWLAAIVGFACTIYVAYRLATPPSDALDAASGIYFGLAGALGVTIGGLLSARDESAAPSHAAPYGDGLPEEHGAGATAEPVGALGGGTWSPAAPQASSSGWSPAAPAAALPPATAAAAAATGERPLQAGDQVVLTAGGTRHPAGTVADVVEVFAGGALVEVRAADGVPERFEVPDSAFDRSPAGGAAAAAAAPAGEDWSPAMPAPASEDWGFDEPGGPAGGAGPNGTGEASAVEPEKKVPWWKREIGGGGKKKAEAAAAAGAVGAVAAGAAVAAHEHGQEQEQKPGLFKRMFGGGSKAGAPETAVLEGEPTAASDVAGVGSAAETDSAIDETPAAAAPAPASEPEPEPVTTTPEPEPPVTPAAATAPEPDVRPAPIAEPEAAAAPEVPEPAPEPPAAESEAAVAPPAPEPPAPEPEVSAQPPSEAAAPEASAPAPEADAGGPSAAQTGAIAAGGAAAGAAAAGGADEEPKPKRRRSSGSRKVPPEVLTDTGQPKVGDQVRLKVGGGKFDAGTRGTVVDVFSAGVIVEMSDDQGRTERLDLPFEAIGPADA